MDDRDNVVDAASVAFLARDVERALRLAGAAATHQVTAGAGLGSILNVEEGRAWNELIATDEQRLAWARTGDDVAGGGCLRAGAGNRGGGKCVR